MAAAHPEFRTYQFHLADANATRALAQSIAPLLTAGDCILFEGPVGAGKTEFCRALIQCLLPHPEDVPSPTFTLVQTYQTPEFEIWHCDLYRLSGPDEVLELGLDDALVSAVTLIEWPDRLVGLELTSPQRIDLSYPASGEGRDITITGDKRWARAAEIARIAL